jgi:sec-independent protein translocase protein TatB
MEDMEKKWKAQNEKIMREHPQGGPHEMEPTGAYPAPASQKPAPAPPVEGTAEARARPQTGGETAAGGDKASSGDTGKPAPPAGESPSDSGKTG